MPLIATDTNQAAGASYIRVPIGASDFSDTAYSLDDTSGDTNLDDFNIDAAPSYLYSTLTDIASINSYLKIHLVPWSPVRRIMSMCEFSGCYH